MTYIEITQADRLHSVHADCIRFVAEQSQGEWTQETINEDAKKMAALVERHRIAALEEAARVAEDQYRGHGALMASMRAWNYEHAGKTIATAIRSLATTPAQDVIHNSSERSA